MLDEKAEILDVKAEMLYKKYWTTRQTAVPEAQRRRVQAASVPEAHRRQSISSQRIRGAQTPEYKQPAYQTRKDARIQAASVQEAYKTPECGKRREALPPCKRSCSAMWENLRHAEDASGTADTNVPIRGSVPDATSVHDASVLDATIHPGERC